MKQTYLALPGALLMLVGPPAAADERKVAMPAVTPQRHAGHLYAGAGLFNSVRGVTACWHPGRRELVLMREDRQVVLRAGSATARINGRPIRLAVAPYLREENLMIPVRLVANALDVPVQYEEPTATLLLGPDAEEVQWAFPLPTRRTGLVLHTPAAGSEWVKLIRVQGQANVPDAEAVVQLQTSEGKVLLENKLPRGHGAFGEFQVIFHRASGEGGSEALRVVAFAPDPKDGSPRHQVTIPLTLHLAEPR